MLKKAMQRLIILFVVLLVSCVPAATPETPVVISPGLVTVALDEAFILKIGEIVGIKGAGFTIRFDAVLEDSRCPKNVQCIQAGQARLGISIEEAGEEPTSLALTLGAAEGAQAVHFDGYLIQLNQVQPYPEAPEVTIAAEEYRATFLISRDEGDNAPYPEPVTSVPLVSGALKTYTDSEVGFALDYPVDWVIENDGVPGVTVFLWSSRPADTGTEGIPAGTTKIEISVLPPATLTLDEFAAQQIEGLLNTNGTILSEERVQLGSGLEGVRLHSDTFAEALSLLVVIGQRPVTVVGFGDLSRFDAVARSLRQVEPSPGGGFSTYLEDGFSLQLPPGWQVSGPLPVASDPDRPYKLYRLGLDPYTSGGPGTSLIAIADPAFWTPESFVLAQCGTCPTSPLEPVTLGGLPALQTAVGGGGVPVEVTWTFIEHDGKLIALAIHDPQTLDPLEEVLQSLQFQP